MYSLLVDQVERYTLAERQVAITAAAAGAKGIEMPDVLTARARFDAMLHAEPEKIDHEQAELLAALGLGRG